MLEQPLRNRFSLVARRVSLGLLLSIGWLFTEGLFPPTRSSALTISQFQRPRSYREWPGYQDLYLFFNVVEPPLLPMAEARGSRGGRKLVDVGAGA